MKKLTVFMVAALLVMAPFVVKASELNLDNNGFHAASTAAGHGPIGVMGDHMHRQGEWMLSYRYMHMNMDGNRIGTSSVDPDTIVTTIANPHAGPPTLRVVPTEMTMDMHMVGAMYAPTDWLTLMVMGMWLEKEMDHITYAGAVGTNILGGFTTDSDGWGDTRLTALYRLYETPRNNLHLNLGVSLPTGSITEQGQVLAPTGARPVLRLPYSMQLGTGTYDLLPGITYYGNDGGKWSWGAQFNAEIRLEDENDESYSWGNKTQMTAWGAYEWEKWVSTSLRLTMSDMDEIDGQDPLITAPVQTADPDNFGGNIIEAGFGVNFIVPRGPLVDHRFAVEANVPIHRDLNGPQLETDWTITLGWQYAF